jgi:hypothetical protein
MSDPIDTVTAGYSSPGRSGRESGVARAARPEVVAGGFPRRRPRWIELTTSADHKDVGRVMIVAALGFLFIALIELLLMRLQLAIPENSLLTPVTFNRMLSLYGATAIFFFAIPLALGLFYYLAPLQIGARGTALPRLGQLGLWLYIAGATVLYAGFLFTPSEAGVNPLAPLSELAFLPNNGVDAWAAANGLATLGFVLIAINLVATLRRMRAPGMAWRRVPVFAWSAAIGSWLLLVIGPVMLAAITMLLIDRNFDGIFFADGSGGAPLLWEHMSWIFFTGAYMLILITALGAIAEIVPVFARKPLFNRGAVIGSMVAIAVIGTLAWIQNMMTSPIGIGWMYFAMIMSLALIVPFGLIVFNLIATMVGGTLRHPADARPLALCPRRDLDDLDRPRRRDLALDGGGRLAPAQHHRRHRGDALRPDRRQRLRRLRRSALLVPEDDRADDGRDPGSLLLLDDGGRHPAHLRAALHRRRRSRPGRRRLQVLRRHWGQCGKPDLHDRRLRAGRRHPADPRQRHRQPQRRGTGRSRPVGRRLARVVRPLAAGAAQLRRPA